MENEMDFYDFYTGQEFFAYKYLGAHVADKPDVRGTSG